MTYHTGMTPGQFHARAVVLSQLVILGDVAAGRVPRDVRDFSHLHDFVDANEYGGFCDDDLQGVFNSIFQHGEYDDPDVLASATLVFAQNAVQNEIDAWIRRGGVTDFFRS